MPTRQTNISLIVAMTPEHVIGKDGCMPWNIPSDLSRFKRLTMEAGTVIMGRKTFDSIMDRIGCPLPGRTSIVLSRRAGLESRNVKFATSVEEALVLAGERASVIGGGEIYALFLAQADALHFTLVEDGGRLTGDTYFPGLPMKHPWEKVEYHVRARRHPRDEYDTTYETWRRRH